MDCHGTLLNTISVRELVLVRNGTECTTDLLVSDGIGCCLLCFGSLLPCSRSRANFRRVISAPCN
eukprot:11174881-Lingulodinium_polyedra.AAC.1